MNATTVFGTDTCPHVIAARAALAARGTPVEYRNVLANPDELREMLRLTQGRRAVPVIVHPDGKVDVGWDGRT